MDTVLKVCKNEIIPNPKKIIYNSIIEESIEFLEDIISQIMGSMVKVECVMEEKKLDQDPVEVAVQVFGEDVVEVVE